MRKVLLKKRKYTYKDILRVIGLGFIHYAFFNLVVVVIVLIKYLISDHTFLSIYNIENGLFLYTTLIAPAFSLECHITYSEKGLPWIRGLMWIHDFGIVFAFIIMEVF